MKKSLFVISAVFIFGIMLIGCATKGDLEKAQAQGQQNSMKADEAIKASQEAKMPRRKQMTPLPRLRMKRRRQRRRRAQPRQGRTRPRRLTRLSSRR